MKRTMEMSADELAGVTGGSLRYINTGMDSKAQIRSAPSTAAGRQDTLTNGTPVDTISERNLVYDEVSGRHFVQISYEKNGVTKYGWIASSLVGLRR